MVSHPRAVALATYLSTVSRVVSYSHRSYGSADDYNETNLMLGWKVKKINARRTFWEYIFYLRTSTVSFCLRVSDSITNQPHSKPIYLKKFLSVIKNPSVHINVAGDISAEVGTRKQIHLTCINTMKQIHTLFS